MTSVTAVERVLIVWDHPGDSGWRTDLFTGRGYVVRAVVGEMDAADELASWPAELICIVVTRPATDAVAWLRRFKAQSPASHVMIATNFGTVPTTVEAMRAGALTVVEKASDPNVWLAAVEHAVVEHAAERPVEETIRGDAARVVRAAKRVGDESLPCGGMVGASEGMRRLYQLISVVAPTDATVLVYGENGTGKELVAAAIHEQSPRASQPFIKINCAAIPADLMESELFGHCKGAFTGAIGEKVGLMEMAAGGSLLLDEIAEMPSSLQVKLLRVLQEREFRPVGGTRVVRANFRLISATNADLTVALSEGRLREDLYFRINTMLLTIPPLRDRTEDIPSLIAHFHARFVSQYDREASAFTPEALDVLTRHPWPGNIRELENVVERAVIVAQGPNISADDLPISMRGAVSTSLSDPLNSSSAPAANAAAPCCHTLAEIEKRAILETLERTSWNKRRAANILGLYRPTLYSKLRKHHIDPQHGSNGSTRRSGAVQKDRTTNG